MKTFLVLLCLFLLVPVAAPAQTTYPAASSVTGGDKVRVLQASGENFVTRDADVSVLLSGVGTPAQRGQSNTVHVAFRTDGRDGIGSLLDPRDGSTHIKFDAILSNAPRSTIIYLHPSTSYETRGAAAHAFGDGSSYRGIRKGVSLIGLGGSARTKITLRSDATNSFGASTIQAFLIGESSDGVKYDADASGTEFSGLEIDVNAQNNPMTNYCISGVALISHGVTVRDLVVRNTRGFTSIEAFGLVITDNADNNTNLPAVAGGSVVDGFRFHDNVSDPHKTASWIHPTAYSYTTALAVSYRNTNYTRVARSVVRNSTIHSTNAWLWSGITGNRDVDFIGNYVGQAVHGYYNDTGSVADVGVTGNVFRDLSVYGVRINNTRASDFRASGNSFHWMARESSQQPATEAARYAFTMTPPSGVVQSNLFFTGNAVGFPTNTASSTYYLYLSVENGAGGVTNSVVRDNTIPFTNTWTLTANGLGLTHANNRTTTWGLMATNDVATP